MPYGEGGVSYCPAYSPVVSLLGVNQTIGMLGEQQAAPQQAAAQQAAEQQLLAPFLHNLKIVRSRIYGTSGWGKPRILIGDSIS